VDQTPGTTQTRPLTQEQQEGSPPAQPAEGASSPPNAAPAPADAAPAPADTVSAPESTGFRPRGRARRRARFLRKARELAYRDLGGLVFNLHRFGQRNDALVLAKLTTLGHIDAELRAIEAALGERQPITVLREAGITACPRCAAIHSSEDSFCPNCGLPMARHADLPAGFQSAAGAPGPPVASAPAPAPTPPSPAAPPAVTTPAPATPAPATPAPAAATPAPATPATATPAPATPATATPAPASPAAATPAVPADEDGPTEILRPSAPGS
jgi:hypothetical protein